MRIALIAPSAIPADTANSIQVMKMAQAISVLGYELRLYAPGRDPQLDWAELASHYGLRQRFDVHWLPRRPLLRGYDYGLRAVKAAQAWGAALIYTRFPQAAAFAAGRGLATIYEIHDLPQGRGGLRLLRRFLAAPGARRLVVISQALRDALSARFEIPARVGVQLAPDGVDLERYAELPTPEEARRKLSLPQAFTAGYTGHLYAGRGLELILEVAARLPEMHFLVAGGRKAEVDRLRAQIVEGRLENVHLTGFIPNADLPLYQAACDALLAPYQARVAASSGGDIAAYLSPMKLFEYLACGRPVLASDLPPLREVLDEANAVLLPSDDVAAWAEALRSLAADPGARRRLGSAAHHTAQKYSWAARAESILSGLA